MAYLSFVSRPRTGVHSALHPLIFMATAVQSSINHGRAIEFCVRCETDLILLPHREIFSTHRLFRVSQVVSRYITLKDEIRLRVPVIYNGSSKMNTMISTRLGRLDNLLLPLVIDYMFGNYHRFQDEVYDNRLHYRKDSPCVPLPPGLRELNLTCKEVRREIRAQQLRSLILWSSRHRSNINEMINVDERLFIR